MAGSSRRDTGVTVRVTSGYVRDLGDDPADPRQRPGQRLGATDGGHVEGVVEWIALDGDLAGPPVTTEPATRRTPSIAIASAPALRSSLIRSSTAGRRSGRPRSP